MTEGTKLDRVEDRTNALYQRPGFLIRRAHQIAVSLFLEEVGDLNITTTQYGALTMLQVNAGLDQVGLGRLVGIDRCTSALVATNLEQAGYIRRDADPNDRRRRILVLTDEGHAALERIAGPALRVQQREMSIFTPRQAEMFLDLLTRFVTAFNDEARTPIEPERGDMAGRQQRRRQNAIARRRLPAKRASVQETG